MVVIPYCLRMISSENRYTLFRIMRLLFAHDLAGAPLHTFWDHALLPPEVGLALLDKGLCRFLVVGRLSGPAVVDGLAVETGFK